VYLRIHAGLHDGTVAPNALAFGLSFSHVTTGAVQAQVNVELNKREDFAPMQYNDMERA
jgi:hypothetical protein